MNRVYQVVWNTSKGVLQAVSELSRRSTGGKRSAAGALPSIAAGALFLFALPLHAANLPTGGHVVGGQGSISSSGKTLTVNQGSQNLAIDWQDFSIAEGHTVNFVQPNAQAAALNRVTGNNISDIRGAINANGRVFLVNPNGVMFSSTARVDVGALVASTMEISTEDFMAGHYTFAGTGSNAVINQGNITAAAGGYVAMIAARIINTGTIKTPQGSTLMGAGSKVTLDLGGPVKIEVEEALLDTYIEQGGAIKADGGLVYLTAKSAGDLASSIINHTGITEARTLAGGADGRIMLMGDMEHGQVQVAGTLDASAPNGGDGGFIETSAAHVNIADDVFVITKADSGKTGEWLIDPADITIAATGGNVTGATIANALQSTDVTLDTSGTGSCSGINCSGLSSGNGDIFINDSIEVTSGNTDTTLTFKAYRNITVDADVEISSSSGKLKTIFWARAGGNQEATDTRIGSVWLAEGARVNTNGGDIVIGGGTDPLTGNAKGSGAGSAEGNAIARGVSINGTLDAGGGDISIRGRGQSGRAGRGVSIAGDISTEGTGNISIYGYASGSSDAVAIGDTPPGINRAGSIVAGNGTIHIFAQRGSGNSINVNNGSSITSSGMLILDGLDGAGVVTAIDNNYLIADSLLVRNAGNVTLSSDLNDINTLAADDVANLAYVNKDALTIGTVNKDGSDYQGIQARGAINIATLNGDLTVAENIATGSGATNAVTLNAGRNAAAGTAAGGDIQISDATISTGTGGRATLYTGSLSGSTGLTDLVGSGSGRFRYNSDEVSIGYSTPIGTGLYAIYREQPTLLVSADSHSISYGSSLPSYTAAYAGFANGDSSAGLTGTVGWSLEAGTTSASGNRVVGSYDVSYDGGLGNGLGYAIANNSSSVGTLTITKLALDLELAGTSSRAYDGTSDMDFSGYSVSANGIISGDNLAIGANSLTGFVDKNVGTNKLVTFTGFDLTGDDAGNYLITDQASTTADITSRSVTVVADSLEKDQGAADPALTYQTSCGVLISNCGLIAGESLAGALSRDSGDTPGSYAIRQGTLNGFSNPNYAIAFTEGELVIAGLDAQGGNEVLASSSSQINQVIASVQSAGHRGSSEPAGSLEFVEVNETETVIASEDQQSGIGPLRLLVVDGGLRQSNDTLYPHQD